MDSYLIDTQSLTLDEFCFRSHSRKWTHDTKGKSRDVVDAFRTIYWFHGLRICVGNLARNLHSLERHLEPEAFGISRYGVCYRHNKWRWYRIGRHTPNDSLVASVERRYEGSRAEITHVLWDILQLQNSAPEHSERWVKRLDPSVQVLLWAKPTRGSIGRSRRLTLDKRTLEVLERRAGLDALACLTLLLREASERGDSEYASELGFRLCRMLLLTSSDLFARGIALPLYDFYDQSILPMASHEGLYWAYKTIPFLRYLSGTATSLR